MIRPLDPSDSTACDAIVASLPDWFGLEEGIRECAEAVRTQPGLVAEVDGEVSGFLTIARPYPQTPEISWLAVHARDRRRGVGRALIMALNDQLRTHGDRLVLVKTLSDRSDPGPEYAETRAFYLAMDSSPSQRCISIPRTRSSCWLCLSEATSHELKCRTVYAFGPVSADREGGGPSV
jgi:GNAT superfamily N-acetyltransferase